MDFLSAEILAKAPELFFPGDMSFDAFPDGTPNVFVKPQHVNGDADHDDETRRQPPPPRVQEHPRRRSMWIES